ncbi:MAG UNVERIFIED_CONTAM: hypothetical protein LVR18_06645 [Planctomycetaceae bacterium]
MTTARDVEKVASQHSPSLFFDGAAARKSGNQSPSHSACPRGHAAGAATAAPSDKHRPPPTALSALRTPQHVNLMFCDNRLNERGIRELMAFGIGSSPLSREPQSVHAAGR